MVFSVCVRHREDVYKRQEMGYGLVPLVDTSQGGDLLERVVMIRRQCAIDLGIIVPVIRIRDNIQPVSYTHLRA